MNINDINQWVELFCANNLCWFIRRVLFACLAISMDVGRRS